MCSGSGSFRTLDTCSGKCNNHVMLPHLAEDIAVVIVWGTRKEFMFLVQHCPRGINFTAKSTYLSNHVGIMIKLW